MLDRHLSMVDHSRNFVPNPTDKTHLALRMWSAGEVLLSLDWAFLLFYAANGNEMVSWSLHYSVFSLQSMNRICELRTCIIKATKFCLRLNLYWELCLEIITWEGVVRFVNMKVHGQIFRDDKYYDWKLEVIRNFLPLKNTWESSGLWLPFLACGFAFLYVHSNP